MTDVSSTLVQRYLDAFNRRDVDALAGLFNADATNVILGDWEEQGVETMRRWSLHYWKAETSEQRAEWGIVDGRECVLVLWFESSPSRGSGFTRRSRK